MASSNCQFLPKPHNDSCYQWFFIEPSGRYEDVKNGNSLVECLVTGPEDSKTKVNFSFEMSLKELTALYNALSRKDLLKNIIIGRETIKLHTQHDKIIIVIYGCNIEYNEPTIHITIRYDENLNQNNFHFVYSYSIPFDKLHKTCKKLKKFIKKEKSKWVDNQIA